MNDLALQTNTSYATITRLINRLGFSGYKEFKKALQQDASNSNSLDFLDVITFNQGTPTKKICQNIYSLSSSILNESFSILDADLIDQAAEAIIHANSVCFVGTGLSGICSSYAYSRFFRIGITSFYNEDITHAKMKASLLKKEDILFTISSSGRSTNILDCVSLAKNNGTQIISLSDYALSPLSQLSDIQLFTTPRNSSQFHDIDIPLLLGQLYIIDTLYMCCCVKLGRRSSDLFIQTKATTNIEKLK
ncbi:MAG: MurR/RpiR family transcriptional regulator [Cellulosilyticaceae bacterium]